MNSFEIAILRILIKRNHQPIAIHSLIEGFPDGLEKQVIDAISYLENLDFINVFSGFPIEEKYVAYNQEKKQEILKVIDPLYNNLSDNRHNISRHTYDGIVQDTRNSNKNKSYVFSLRQSAIKPINITISIICIIFTGFILTSVPETNEIEHFYNLSYKYFKFKDGDSQVYANDDKKYWKAKFMNPDNVINIDASCNQQTSSHTKSLNQNNQTSNTQHSSENYQDSTENPTPTSVKADFRTLIWLS